MFGIPSKYPLDKIACNSCDDPEVIRLIRHRACFNQFVLMIWLVIPFAFLYSRNHSFAWLLLTVLTLFCILSVIQIYRMIKFYKREKEEWYLFCLSCKHMGTAPAKDVTDIEVRETE
ncbi:hypothetical protein F9U64_20200 [Gracilibacillus oryzae]|uniref:Uncharacterized protein n=1 Tax=Gracilibacillus oryzae TaxID=1672701 RepID=A0A7C8GQV8_9BACI|nr:hypothetical protein [Gracilibacillus oryzae]KAB8126385.1 hypothetical protein F9U64_20200 [Gracilibacillus oryzae]